MAPSVTTASQWSCSTIRREQAMYSGQARWGSTPLSTTRSWAPPVRTTLKSLAGHDTWRVSPSTSSTVGRSWVKS